MKVLDEGIGKLIQPADLYAFRKSNRSKPKQLVDKRMSDLAGRIAARGRRIRRSWRG